MHEEHQIQIHENANKFTRIIEEAILNLSCIRIYRDQINDENISCIPIKQSKNFLLIHYFVDFYYDGFKIIRMKDISNIEKNEEDQFFEMILKQEGIYKQLENIKVPFFTDWKKVLQYLAGEYNCLIIECEFLKDYVFVGKIVNILESGIEFCFLSMSGKFEKESDFIEYKDITCVSFNDNYTKTIVKYAKN